MAGDEVIICCPCQFSLPLTPSLIPCPRPSSPAAVPHPLSSSLVPCRRPSSPVLVPHPLSSSLAPCRRPSSPVLVPRPLPPSLVSCPRPSSPVLVPHPLSSSLIPCSRPSPSDAPPGCSLLSHCRRDAITAVAARIVMQILVLSKQRRRLGYGEAGTARDAPRAPRCRRGIVDSDEPRAIIVPAN